MLSRLIAIEKALYNDAGCAREIGKHIRNFEAYIWIEKNFAGQQIMDHGSLRCNINGQLSSQLTAALDHLLSWVCRNS